MKKILLFIFAAFTLITSQAQNCNAILFNQDGNSFQVILNGILQNSNFETNVKITDLSFKGSYKVTVIFEDNKVPNLEKTIYMMESNTEYTYNIKKNKKGKYVLRAQSFVPIAQATQPAPTQAVIIYSTTPAPAPTQTVTQTISTSTTSHNNGTQDNVYMGVQVGDVGMNLNINVNDGGSHSGTTTSSYSETTTTSSNYTNEPTSANDHYIMAGYNGSIGCPYPMSDSDFNSAKQSVASKDFSESKLIVAKQITKVNCLTSNQAKQIIQLFDFDKTKLEYAKFAYGHTFDIGNYYQVNDAFDFDSSIRELNDYINGK